MEKNKGDTIWTPEQLAAIETRGCNLLVAAAAGSGKTAVLVERIIRRITDEKNPIDIDRLLIVTFTNAAATEMRERIGDAIAKELEKRPESRQLQRQLSLLHKATITTIHSFCLEVIKNNFHKIDLDPGFRIANETEAVLMKLEGLEELFEEKYDTEQQDSAFFQLVECYGGSKDDRALQDMVFTLRDYIQSSPWPEEWLKQQAEAFNIPVDTDFSNTKWGKELIEAVKVELKGILSSMKKAMDTISKAQGLGSYLPIYQEDVDKIGKLLIMCDGKWDELCKEFSALDFARLPRCGRDTDKDIQGHVKAIRDEAKKQLKRIKDEMITSFSREIIEDLSKLYPLMKCLCDLVIEYNNRYDIKKKEKALVDFNDLEHYCLDILTVKGTEGLPSEAARELQNKFEEIMVDEYQDSNMVQEVIINAISRKDTESPNVFTVGDVKQSIYRFRQAMPELFMHKYNTYSDGSQGKCRRIKLNKNFRSREEILNGVNYIFEQIMSINVGELDYTPEEALNPGAKFSEAEAAEAVTGGAIELHLIDMAGNNAEGSEFSEEYTADDSEAASTEEQEEPKDQIETEARLVAMRINRLMQPDENGRRFCVYDKSLNKYRPIQYKDIVVLLRTTRNWADVFVEEMTSHGIPAYADTGTGFFMTVEVQTVISLLQIIDNPMQDIPLLAVLRSPIVSLTPEELIDIRLADKEATIYEAVERYISSTEGSTTEKLKSFMDKLKKWRTMATYMPTDELIWYLYTDTGYYSYVGIIPGGTQRQANLRVLFERARQYEETSFKGLFNFIHFINKLKSSQGDMGSAKILGENEDVVRIMSIHKSKGLEFPVVFVSGTGKNFNLQDMNRRIILHQDLGLGPDFVDYKRRISYPTVAKQALRYRIKKESLSEEMRILYVAFTRAKEKLIITGAVRDLNKAAANWCRNANEANHSHGEAKKIPDYITIKARNYLDWIGPAVSRHRDCVVLPKIAGIDGLKEYSGASDSQWDIKIWDKDSLFGVSQTENEKAMTCSFETLDVNRVYSEYEEEIKRKLNWVYSYTMSPVLPVKISVTELKRRFNVEAADDYSETAYVPQLVKKPMFLEARKGLSATEKGTVVHFIMQHLDIKKKLTAEEIRNQIKTMVERQMLTEQQMQSINPEKLALFFETSLARRMLASDHIKREVPFNIHVKCKEIFPDLPQHYEDEVIILQGVIDCYFEEDNEIVLIDYKTDYVEKNVEEQIKEKYASQLDYYSKALQYITGKKVKEKYIYLFWNNRIIAM